MTTCSVIEEICLNQQYLLAKYGDQGKDLFEIYKEGGMTDEDAKKYDFILRKLDMR